VKTRWNFTLCIASKEATHFQVGIPTLIDLCITNEPDSLIIFSQLSLPGMKTEHDLIYMVLIEFAKTRQAFSYLLLGDFKNIDREELNRATVSANWLPIFQLTDPNKQVRHFNSQILTLFHLFHSKPCKP
jgi:hypothetical protein